MVFIPGGARMTFVKMIGMNDSEKYKIVYNVPKNMYINLLNLFVLLHREIFSILNIKNRYFYIDMALSIVKTTELPPNS
jgi:hypothetical protein